MGEPQSAGLNMSYYSLIFTVPKNTAEETPVEQKLLVHPGILHQVSVLIPPGHAGLTGVAIDAGLHQIAPSSQNTWFMGDDSLFSYPEWIEITQGLAEIGIRGFNVDDTYNHSFVIGVGVLPESALNAAIQIGDALNPLSAGISQIAKFFSPPRGA